MSVWTIRHKWNDRFIRHYQRRVKAIVQRELDRGARYTCEDLALHVIISFAAYYGLPVSIKNESNPLGYDPRDFSGTLAEFRNEVLRTTAAKDFPRFGNTVGFSGTPGSLDNFRHAQAGDMIHLTYSDYHHIQVITEVSAGRTTIVQGNLHAFYRDSDPSGGHYAGAALRERHYDQEGNYDGRTSDGAVQHPFQGHQGRVRRWNFRSWNTKPASSDLALPFILLAP